MTSPLQLKAMLAVERAKTASFEKEALLERLVRLGATDVPNTPRLFMRKRSPEELAGLQHGVDAAFNKVQQPMKEGVGRLMEKAPLPAMAKKVLSAGANTIIDNPETLPMLPLPVPGLMPAYLAGKKGLEKLIDRVAPLSKMASVETDPVIRGLFEELEKFAHDTKLGEVNIGQWWETEGGPFLAKGGSHSAFEKKMSEAGIPPAKQKVFFRMAKEKYPPGYNRRGVPFSGGGESSDGGGGRNPFGGFDVSHVFRGWNTPLGAAIGGLGAAAPLAALAHSGYGKRKEDEAQDPSRLRGRIGAHLAGTVPTGLAGATLGGLLGSKGRLIGALAGTGLGALASEANFGKQEEMADKRVRSILRRDPERMEKGKKKAENEARKTVAGNISQPKLLESLPGLALASLGGPHMVAMGGLGAASGAEGGALLNQYQSRLVHQKLNQPKEKAAAGAPTRGGFMMASDVPPLTAPSLRAPVQKLSGEVPEKTKAADSLPDYVTYNASDFKPVNINAKYKAAEGAGDGMSMSQDTAANNQAPEDYKSKKADVSPSVPWSGGTGGTQRQESYIPPMKVPSLRAPLAKVGAAGLMPAPAPPPAPTLSKTMGVPKMPTPGPSIAEVAKPKGPGFGSGIAGAFKPNSGVGGTGPVDLGAKLGPGGSVSK